MLEIQNQVLVLCVFIYSFDFVRILFYLYWWLILRTKQLRLHFGSEHGDERSKEHQDEAAEQEKVTSITDDSFERNDDVSSCS